MLFSIIVNLVIVSEKVGDLSLHLLSPMSHIQKLKCLLNRYCSLEVFVIHQELNKVIQLSGLQTNIIGYDTFVHGQVLILRNIAVKIVIHLPNDE